MRLALGLNASILLAAAACGTTADPTAYRAPAEPTAAAPTVPPTTSPTPPVQDAALPDDRTLASRCFADLVGLVPGPDYDKFAPTIAASCAGTHHQMIADVEKLVFMGDSITAGTPPTLPGALYRSHVTAGVKARFGNDVEVADCSAWGSETGDFFDGKKQLGACFPDGGSPKRTLVVMTMGGNDIARWATAKLGTTAALAEAEVSASRLGTAIDWMKAPGRFPGGIFVVFANVYDYTDTAGDLSSCPASGLVGLSGSWPEGAPAVVRLQERFMEIATRTGTDMIFLLEHFCGHGFRRDDPSLQCYRGPGAELWFDVTCIHPSPAGHEHIADLFMKVIAGS